MMASEATLDDIATSTVTLDHELNTDEVQDVVLEESLLNGSGAVSDDKDKTKQETENADAIVNSAEVSVSGGSDTEASKPDTKDTGDEKGHIRTASTVKKVFSFKPVSVNKTFLAAKGATAVPPSKLGEKGAPGATASQNGQPSTIAPRPRLVAKLGSSLRDAAPRASTVTNGGKSGAAPDASAVWNKNRPAPPPEPKRFTDEELKQRYGIHLATRLQSDDPGKQANWADIDDDDDDWAPETIEWTDGTKITLPQADEAISPAPEPVPDPILTEFKAPEISKPSSPVSAPPSATTAAKTSVFGGRTGLVLKGASEKPTLVVKPPGPPTPVKSPWAALPPIDKVAPIAIEIPQNQQSSQGRFLQRDPHGFQAMPAPPAKEIAADDFSRSWREGSSNTSRELYNSQSGRYEPVNDNRRGSVRNDAHGRQPALLQRPSHQDGPAEPSAAFQTHRAGGQDPAYGRRRTSSNVSGGSGNPNLVRRMSRGHDMPPPQEAINVRRGSLAAVSDAPSSPRNYSPSGQPISQRGPPVSAWQARASPAISHQSPQSAHSQMVPTTASQSQPTTAAPEEDPIEIQKEVMRRKRELAIKRRQEEEEKEEAARKERIRIKLEAMGPPPESRKKKDAVKEEKAAPTQIQTRETDRTPPLQTNATVAEAEPNSNDVSVLPAEEKSIEAEATDAPAVEKPSSNRDNRPNGVESSSGVSGSVTSAGPDNQPGKSWPNNQGSNTERFNGWVGPPTKPVPPRNVWGPPTNDRSLGNGTFNPELSRVPEIHQSSNPGPIGPPSQGNSQNHPGRGRELYGSKPGPIGPPNRHAGVINPEQRTAMASSGWSGLPERLAQEEAKQFQQHEVEGAKRREMQEAGLAQDLPQPTFKDTWRQVSINEDGSRSKVQAVSTTVLDPKPQGNSTWKNYPDKAPEDGLSRATFEENENARRRYVEGLGNNPQQQFNEAWRSAPGMSASPPVRGSRFFPSSRDIRFEDGYAPLERPGSPTPPPPTMAGHPAYDGDIAHPHVALPPPIPVVKLPPTVLAPIGPPKPISFAAAVSTPVAAPPQNDLGYTGRHEHSGRQASSYQDIRRFPETVPGGWQDRINSLIGRKNSPPKPHLLAVDSSSKNALEAPHSPMAATVSLPSSISGDLSIDYSSVFSKPASEECFEEQEMGSLPIVKCPSVAPANAWEPAPDPKIISRRFMLVDATTIESLPFQQPTTEDDALAISILLPGQQEAKSVRVPLERREKNTPRRGNVRGVGPRHPSRGANNTRGRGRDTVSGFQSPGLDTTTGTSNPPMSAIRGGRRGGGYGSNWTRHVSAPVHT